MWCLLHCLGRNYSITVLIKTQSSDSQLSGLPLIVGQTSGGALEFKLLQFLSFRLCSCNIQPESAPLITRRASLLVCSAWQTTKSKQGTEPSYYFDKNEHIVFVFNLAHYLFLSVSAEAGPGPWKMTVWLNAVKWHLWRVGTNNINSNGNELYLRGCHRSGSCCLLFRSPAIIISMMV